MWPTVGVIYDQWEKPVKTRTSVWWSPRCAHSYPINACLWKHMVAPPPPHTHPCGLSYFILIFYLWYFLEPISLKLLGLNELLADDKYWTTQASHEGTLCLVGWERSLIAANILKAYKGYIEYKKIAASTGKDTRGLVRPMGYWLEQYAVEVLNTKSL